jgi:hypothetical protein
MAENGWREGPVVISSSVNRLALVVAVLLAAGIGWIALRNGDLLLIALALGLLVVAPFVRRPEGADDGGRLASRVDRFQVSPVQPAPSVVPSLVPATPVAGMSPGVRDQIIAGNKIGAIKRYREEYGVGLKEAKDAVEGFERQLAVDGVREPGQRY